MIDTEGSAVGQVNGLHVLSLGGFTFGSPARISARVRMGAGKVIDIERETKLGGPLHSKGVLILSSYLAASFATMLPMSLWASIVFEQSYGGVRATAPPRPSSTRCSPHSPNCPCARTSRLPAP
jgi:predicted ATP-dependent protease